MQIDKREASRIERKKEITRAKITAAAAGLFKAQGVDATTMEQIAEEADIAKGTLYNYFPVKEAIISEIIRRSSNEMNTERIRRLPDIQGTRTRMVIMLGELVKGMQVYQEIFERYLVYQMQQVISFQPVNHQKIGFQRLANRIIELGQAEGEIRTDLPEDILEDLFNFIFIEIAKQYYRNPSGFDATQTIAGCVDLFVKAVQPDSSS